MEDSFETEIESGRIVNFANLVHSTRALGPGTRAALWVQGCALNCTGCIAPEWIPRRRNNLAIPDNLAEELLSESEVTGITFSGGEPMLQAAGLANVIKAVRRKRDVSLICFSGYTLEQIKNRSMERPVVWNRSWPPRGMEALLAEIDVLIDGPYQQEKNDNRGLRGSSNQHIIYLTDRLIGAELETSPRKAELVIYDGFSVLVGVPPTGFKDAFDNALQEARRKLFDEMRRSSGPGSENLFDPRK